MQGSIELVRYLAQVDIPAIGSTFCNAYDIIEYEARGHEFLTASWVSGFVAVAALLGGLALLLKLRKVKQHHLDLSSAELHRKVTELRRLLTACCAVALLSALLVPFFVSSWSSAQEPYRQYVQRLHGQGCIGY